MDEEKRLSVKKNVIFCVIAVLIACILLFPLYWTLITSLKTETEIFQNPPTFFSPCGKYKVLRGTGENRRFQYV